jgi:hypothetical protein
VPKKNRAVDDVQVLDPHNLRGLAHPLRMRLLGLLRLDGPSTATKLAARVGESSGATSYHLRQLAAYGFVVEDAEHAGSGRERWWRAAARFTQLPRTTAREAIADTEGFLRALANDFLHEIDGFLNELPSLPPAWDDGWTMSDRVLRLTPAEAKRLRREVLAVVERYREDQPGESPDTPKSAARVIMQIQMLPRLPTGATS